VFVGEEDYELVLWSYTFALRIVDRIFYYFIYAGYFLIEFALYFCSSKSPLPKISRIIFILLFPISLLGLFCLLILISFIDKGTIDVTELRWENKKFLNNLVSDKQDKLSITNDTKFVWQIYNLTITNSQSFERVDDPVIEKIMHIFQYGTVTLNAVDISSMLKTITMETTDHYEGFVEKQLNQQVVQLVDMISKTNEMTQEHTNEVNSNHDMILQSSLSVSAKVDQLHEVMHESQSVLNSQVKEMIGELNNRLDLLQSKETSLLEQKAQEEQKNMYRFQQFEQANMDLLEKLEQKIQVAEQKNMYRFEQLEQKMDALLNILNEKYTK
jgi:hypothetical protein